MLHYEYAKIPGITASAMKAARLSIKPLEVSMLQMRCAMTERDRGESAAMRLGRLCHSAILEPDIYSREARVWRGRVTKSGPNKGEITMARSGPEWSAFVEESGGEQWIVNPDEHAELLRMTAAVHANAHAHRLIEQTVHEQPLVWCVESTYGDAKGRLDGMGEVAGILDIKTTAHISRRAFGSSFFQQGNDIQFGWYAEGWCVVNGGRLPPAHIIRVQSDYPYDVAVLRVRSADLMEWRKSAVQIAEMYRAAERAGEWPGVVPSGLEDFQPPEWLAVESAEGMAIGSAAEL